MKPLVVFLSLQKTSNKPKPVLIVRQINIGAGKDRQNHWAGEKTFLPFFTETVDTSDRTKPV